MLIVRYPWMLWGLGNVSKRLLTVSKPEPPEPDLSSLWAHRKKTFLYVVMTLN